MLVYLSTHGIAGGFLTFLAIVCPIVVLIVGSFAMERLRHYGLATAAGILAVVPWYPAWFIGFFIGIWVLQELAKPETRAAFAFAANPAAKSFEDWLRLHRAQVSKPEPRNADATRRAEPRAPKPLAFLARAPRFVFGKANSFARSVGYYCFDSLRSRLSAAPPSAQVVERPTLVADGNLESDSKHS